MPERRHTMTARLRYLIISLFVLSAVAFTLSVADAHEADESVEGAEKLGTVHFPTSCLPEAQPRFNRAVAILHSFWYPETLKAFADVIEADPKCAIAYWGLGMSNRPNPFV